MPHIARACELVAALEKRTDQEVVLFGLAYLDLALEAALMCAFHYLEGDPEGKKLFGDGDSQGVIGTTYAKLLLAKAMNLLSPAAYDDLNIIRKMRNPFAHAPDQLSFENSHVIALTEGLLTPDFMAEHDNLQRLRPNVQYISALKDRPPSYEDHLFICVKDTAGETRVLLHVGQELEDPSAAATPADRARARFIQAVKVRWYFLMATALPYITAHQEMFVPKTPPHQTSPPSSAEIPVSNQSRPTQ